MKPVWRVIVDDATELVELGDGDLFPRTLDARVLELAPITMQPDDSRPIVALRLAVNGGRPVPVYVAIVRGEWAELLSEDLRIPLTRMVDEVIRFEKQQIFERFNPPPLLSGLGPGVLAAHRAWGNRFNATGSERAPRRRSVTPERLEEVAVIYQRDNSGRPTRAVAEALNMSHSSAARWVGLARQHGLLPPYSDQGTKERKT